LESLESIGETCLACGAELAAKSNFCKHCGTAINHKEIRLASEKKKNLQSIALFFAIEVIICVVSLLIEQQTIAINLFFDFAMAIVAIVFFASDWNENKPLLKWPNFSTSKLISLVLLTITASFAVQFLVSHLNQLLFDEDYTYFFFYAGQKYGQYIMMVSVALFPALFEELAYRGFLMQKLLKIVDPKEAILISSILFFFVHFSMISFFWMLPFALLLGYVRSKYNTLWYGVAMHFFFNLTSCLIDIYQYGGH
jgi:membrane protease YdiL (CAAX protease family)